MRPALKRLAIKIDPTFSAPHHHLQREVCGARVGLLPSTTIAWAIGSAAGLLVADIDPTTWLVVACTIASATVLTCCRSNRTRFAILIACFICVGAARSAIQRTMTTSEHAVLTPFSDGRIVRVDGLVSSNPIPVDVRVGQIESFGHVPNPILFTVSHAMVSWSGSPRLKTIDSLRVFVQSTSVASIAVQCGDRISLRGRLCYKRPPSNPNPSPQYGSEPWVDVPSPSLISLKEMRSSTGISTVAANLEGWRSIVKTGLDEALSNYASHRARALVRAIVLGIRTESFDRISEPYRRTGLAHYLAVSGFALGVLVAIPTLLLIRCSPFLRGVAITIVVVLGMLAIDLRAPAIRAGLVACALALGSTLGRDWSRQSLLALAALVLLLIDPSEILRPGFQLSFAVVTALLLLAPVLARRIPLPIPAHEASLRTLPLSWLRSALACGIVAWGTATPIVLYHFGIVSPIGVVLSILAAPLVALIVACAVAAIASSFLVPSISLAPGSIAAWSAHLLDTATVFCAQIPGACIVLPTPPFIWVLLVEFVFWRWILHVRPTERTILVASTLALILYLFLAPNRTTEPGSAELLTLDVGNGSCHIVTGPRGSVLVDAGSSSVTSCAQRIVLPALRANDIRYLDAVLITHANLDHFAALADLFGRIPIETVFIGESFVERARLEPEGAAARLLDIARSWHIPIRTIAAGSSHTLGGLRWRIIHPHSGTQWKLENDSSLVVRVEHELALDNTPAAILFTGDIEEDGMRSLLRDSSFLLSARILEAPHHGSTRSSSCTFINTVDPDLVVQSSGMRRLQRDDLHEILNGRPRASTARSGAIHVHQAYQGDTSVSCYRGNE